MLDRRGVVARSRASAHSLAPPCLGQRPASPALCKSVRKTWVHVPSLLLRAEARMLDRRGVVARSRASAHSLAPPCLGQRPASPALCKSVRKTWVHRSPFFFPRAAGKTVSRNGLIRRCTEWYGVCGQCKRFRTHPYLSVLPAARPRVFRAAKKRAKISQPPPPSVSSVSVRFRHATT